MADPASSDKTDEGPFDDNGHMDTPRTDAAEKECRCTINGAIISGVVTASFARRLERELADAIKTVEFFQKREEASRVSSAVRAIEPQNLTLARERDEALAQRDYWKRTAESLTPSAIRPISTENPTMKITVNGIQHPVGTTSGLTLGDPEGTGHLGYDQIVELAGYDPERVLTVVYSTRRPGDEQRQGSMTKGKTVRIEDGMVFNVADTSNA